MLPLRDYTEVLVFIPLLYNSVLGLFSHKYNDLLVMRNVEAFTQEYTKCWENIN
jgi:hypothetical protein